MSSALPTPSPGPGADWLVVVDLAARGRPDRSLRRLLGLGALSLLGASRRPWLVLAPAGDGGDRSWCRGAAVLEPAALFDSASREALLHDVLEVANVIVTALEPDRPSLPLGELNRGLLQDWVLDLMYRERAVVTACRSLGLRRCLIVSSDLRRAHWLVGGVEAAGIKARAVGFPGWWRRRVGESGPSQRWLAPELPHADLLLVAESTPMAEMFTALESAFPSDIQGRTLRLSYGSAASRNGSGPVRHVQPTQQPGDGADPPVGDPLVGEPGLSGLQGRSGDLPRSVLLSFDSLRHGLVFDWRPQQEAWASHVSEVLDKVRPRALVVGNDRFWTGQTFVRLARDRGIRTFCLQDGIGAEDPHWAFSCADHVLASGSLWPRLMQRFRPNGTVASVVGQPRYDEARQRFLALRQDRNQASNAEPHVLLVLQEIHGADYAAAVLEELLRIDAAEVLIRPHPSHDATEFDHLRGKRVRVDASGEVIAHLAWADAVVTEYSTVAVESLALGLPLVSVTLSGRPPMLDFSVRGQAEAVTDKSLISEAVSRMLETSRMGRRSVAERDALLDELVGPLDGNSSSRAAAIIGESLQPLPA